MNLNSVERVQEYTEIPSEAYHVNDDPNRQIDNNDPHEDAMSCVPSDPGVSSSWPAHGEIDFKNIYMKYASASDFVLR